MLCGIWGVDLARVARLLNHKLVIDLRNIYQPQEMAAAGLGYLSLGRPTRQERLAAFPPSAPQVRARV